MTIRTVILYLSFFLLSVSLVNGLSLQLEPKTSECFFEQVPANTELTLYYQVVRGGLLDIKLTVTTIPFCSSFEFLSFRSLLSSTIIKVETPSGNLLYETLHFEEEDDGIYDFIPREQGYYKFCFNNEMSRWTAKVVSFYLISDEDEEDGANVKPTPASTGKILAF
jgi:hypothetical protein